MLQTGTLPAGTYSVIATAGLFTSAANIGNFRMYVKTSENTYGAVVYYDNASNGYFSALSTGGKLTLTAPGTISLVAEKANNNAVNLPEGRGYLQVIRVA